MDITYRLNEIEADIQLAERSTEMARHFTLDHGPALVAALRLVLNRHSEHASTPGQCSWCEQPYPCSELRDINAALNNKEGTPNGHQ